MQNKAIVSAAMILSLVSACPKDDSGSPETDPEISGIIEINTTLENIPTTGIGTVNGTIDESSTSIGENTTSILNSTGVDSTTDYFPECGNNILDPGEECDEPSYCTECIKDRYFFVTSNVFLIGDLIFHTPRTLCKMAADKGGLTREDSIFTAFIVYDNYDIYDFPAFENAKYVFPNTNKTFVNKYEDVYDSDTILRVPNFDEYGEVHNNYVWTGYNGFNCQNWMNAGSVADIGLNTSVDYWLSSTNGDLLPCAKNTFALYCIEVQNLGQDEMEF